MIESESISAVPATEDPNPYGDLFIYYLEGHLERAAEMLGPNFIGNWEEDAFSFLFFSKPSIEIVKKLLKRQPQLTILDKYHMTYEQWHGDRISAFQVGRFLITPPWEKRYGEGGQVHIVLDPGVVFGSGLHPTTHDCLKAVETAFRYYSPDTVVDLGTGTGLLALAAAKSGCRQVLAVDKNLLAVKTAHRNIVLNRMEACVSAVQGTAERLPGGPAGLFIANIHYEVMERLIAQSEFLNNEHFILSGLLRSQARKVVRQLSDLPVRISEQWAQDGIWYTLLGERC